MRMCRKKEAETNRLVCPTISATTRGGFVSSAEIEYMVNFLSSAATSRSCSSVVGCLTNLTSWIREGWVTVCSNTSPFLSVQCLNLVNGFVRTHRGEKFQVGLALDYE